MHVGSVTHIWNEILHYVSKWWPSSSNCRCLSHKWRNIEPSHPIYDNIEFRSITKVNMGTLARAYCKCRKGWCTSFCALAFKINNNRACFLLQGFFQLLDKFYNRLQGPTIPREIPLVVSLSYYAFTMLLARVLRIVNGRCVPQKYQLYTGDLITAFQICACSLENSMMRR